MQYKVEQNNANRFINEIKNIQVEYANMYKLSYSIRPIFTKKKNMRLAPKENF